jgi:hypothetical protein
MRKHATKRTAAKILTPLSAFAAMIALGVPGADAQPVFEYNFPASWNGTGSVITDQSAAGNNGTFDGTLTLDSAVPPGAAAGTQSINTSSGGILTGGTQSLNNAAVAAAGGFTYNVAFKWNGTDLTSFGHTQKLIDYAGTESLHLVTTTGSASLQMVFANNAGAETIANSTTIFPNTWYTVSLAFDATGRSVDGSGALSGWANMSVNGSLVSSVEVTKGNYGDSLNRPIGVGQLGAPFGYLVGFKGDLFDPTVNLGIVPEPSPTALLGMFGGLAVAWKFFRRKV